MFKLMQTPKQSQAVIGAISVLLVSILVILIYPYLPISNNPRQPIPEFLRVNNQASLIHVGTSDSFQVTESGKEAARYVWDFLETGNPKSGQAAVALYEELIPKENYGGEYSALQWFSEYLLADDAGKKQFLENPYTASFFEYFAADNFAPLKEYLQRKYHLVQLDDEYTEYGQNRLNVLEDFILFNNPRREDWEKTSKIVESLHLKPGEVIVDVGSGPGYYSFQFSDLVGEKGKVYAVDTVSSHLKYVQEISEKYNVNNIETVHTSGNTIGIPENTADRVFLCSLYHNIYGLSTEAERQGFVRSIYTSLKKNGKLILVDNAMVAQEEIPYHGPYIAKELIIGQMKYFGFHLVDDYAFIPQRYVLVFEKV